MAATPRCEPKDAFAMRPTLPSTLPREIDVRLEESIIEGRLRPGQRLIAEDLAEEFGVSRIPIREALRSLDSAGWVEIRARHGVYVREWSRRDLDDLFEVRTMLESQSARLAAKRRTPAQLKLLHENVEKYTRAIGRTPTKIPELNREFHSLIAECAANRTLRELLDQLGKRVKWYYSTVTVVRSPESSLEHGKLLDAIESGQSAMAAKLMVTHVHRTRAAIVKVLTAREATT